MVLFKVDSNTMLVQEMWNQISGELVASYNILVMQLKKVGFEPKLHLLDHECSQEYKEAIIAN